MLSASKRVGSAYLDRQTLYIVTGWRSCSEVKGEQVRAVLWKTQLIQKEKKNDLTPCLPQKDPNLLTQRFACKTLTLKLKVKLGSCSEVPSSVTGHNPLTVCSLTFYIKTWSKRVWNPMENNRGRTSHLLLLTLVTLSQEGWGHAGKDLRLTYKFMSPELCHFNLLDVERLASPLPSDPRNEQVVMVFVSCHL